MGRDPKHEDRDQFDFGEIHRRPAHIAAADIVCGYSAGRQDPFIRKLNACGWNALVRLLFEYN